MDKYLFNKEASLNAVLYIANRVKRKDFHKIFKILYFSDREHIYQFGKPLTGDIYIAMNNGPVPSKIYDIFKIVRGDSYCQDKENFEELFFVENNMYINPLKDADMDYIPKRSICILDESINKCDNLSFDELTEKSHDTAWRSTALDYPIEYSKMALEAGANRDDLEYIKDLNKLSNYLQ